MNRSVRDAAVLVTGAGSGIGKACCEGFADAGAVIAVTDVTDTRAEDVARSIRDQGGRAKAWKLDVSDRHEIKSTVAAVAREFGRLDIIINNAGIAASSSFDDESYEAAWQSGMEINVAAHHRVIRAALPYLKTSPAGRIVNIASIEGLGASRGHSIYSISKTAVVGLTRSMAVELGPDGITCNCVCPGPVETEMTSFISEQDKRVFAKRFTALGRFAHPAEIADVVLSLCLPSATFITGAIVPVDGGFIARNS